MSRAFYVCVWDQFQYASRHLIASYALELFATTATCGTFFIPLISWQRILPCPAHSFHSVGNFGVRISGSEQYNKNNRKRFLRSSVFAVTNTCSTKKNQKSRIKESFPFYFNRFWQETVSHIKMWHIATILSTIHHPLCRYRCSVKRNWPRKSLSKMENFLHCCWRRVAYQIRPIMHFVCLLDLDSGELRRRCSKMTEKLRLCFVMAEKRL